MEIERTLKKYGATAFGYLSQPGRATILFEIRGRRVRFFLPLPDSMSAEFTRHSRGWRTEEQAQRLCEQACRSRWRALLLVIKAKLEAVEAAIVTLEAEFLPYTVLPNGQKVSEFYQPQVDLVFQSGRMPEPLPGVKPLALPVGCTKE